jgi:ketosteroid isomerase-like protein
MSVTAAPSRDAIERIVKKYFDAVSALDADGYVGCFAEDGISHDPEGAPPHLGPAACREFFGGIAGLCEACNLTPEAVYIAGSGAAVPWRLTARGRNGKEAVAQGVDVITVNAEGHIQELHAYWDAQPFIATLTS